MPVALLHFKVCIFNANVSEKQNPDVLSYYFQGGHTTWYLQGL